MRLKVVSLNINKQIHIHVYTHMYIRGVGSGRGVGGFGLFSVLRFEVRGVKGLWAQGLGESRVVFRRPHESLIQYSLHIPYVRGAHIIRPDSP